jgi:hypothetical protein
MHAGPAIAVDARDKSLFIPDLNFASGFCCEVGSQIQSA